MQRTSLGTGTSEFIAQTLPGPVQALHQILVPKSKWQSWHAYPYTQGTMTKDWLLLGWVQSWMACMSTCTFVSSLAAQDGTSMGRGGRDAGCRPEPGQRGTGPLNAAIVWLRILRNLGTFYIWIWSFNLEDQKVWWKCDVSRGGRSGIPCRSGLLGLDWVPRSSWCISVSIYTLVLHPANVRARLFTSQPQAKRSNTFLKFFFVFVVD